MAKYENSFTGDFYDVLALCENAILDYSATATCEDSSDWKSEDTIVATRVFERYSWSGKNRVSLSLTLVGKGRDLFVSAITAGGSQALFMKINTWGENAFLDTLIPTLEKYASSQNE